MRIAHVIAGAKLGGAETFHERVCLAMHGAGHEVLPVIRREPERAERLRAGGLEPVELPFGGPLDLMTGLRLRSALRRFQPEVAVAWMNRAARFTPRGSGARPWVLVGRLGGYYDLRYYRRCDHLIGITRDLVRWIVEQGWDPSRVHRVPNFAPDFAGATPAELPSAPGVTRLLAIGRLHVNKGFDTLLRALAGLPRAHLWLAGEGPERPALEKLARELGLGERVTFLGWRRDTGALLAACDIFIVPSRHEPFGSVLLEGFSSGKPMVATASQGARELVTPEENGLVVPVDDPEAMTLALAALIADPARAAMLGAAGRAAFEASYSEPRVLKRWHELLPRLRRREAGPESP